MSTDTGRRGPRFTALDSADLDRQQKDVVLRLVSDEGLQFTMKVHQAIIPNLVAILLAQANKLPRDPTGPNMQPITLMGAHKLVVPDGRVGLELLFDIGLNLPALIPPKGIAGLRKALTAIEALAAPPRPGGARH